jgi:isocitrate lyase
MLNSGRLLIAAATVIAVAAGGAGVTGADASSNYKRCGHVDGTVAVTVTKGNVSCSTARAVAKAWDKTKTVPNGFHCKTHSSNAGSGHYGVCKKGTTKTVVATPE